MSRPGRYDVLVLGGGTAGCVLAARLSEDPGTSVCLVEAGSDYGPRDGRGLARRDARRPGWRYADLAPYLDRARHALGMRTFAPEELSPWHAAFAEAAGDDAIVHPVNADGAVRNNAAFAYLDPARRRPNLTILGDTIADRPGRPRRRPRHRRAHLGRRDPGRRRRAGVGRRRLAGRAAAQRHRARACLRWGRTSSTTSASGSCGSRPTGCRRRPPASRTSARPSLAR